MQKYLARFTDAWSVVQPAFVFLGEEFAQSKKHQHLKSLLVDMFQGSPTQEVNAMAVRRVLVCSVLSCGRVSLRQYSIQLLNAPGSKVRLALCCSCYITTVRTPLLLRIPMSDPHGLCQYMCTLVLDHHHLRAISVL
jgi:hypothetical protein